MSSIARVIAILNDTYKKATISSPTNSQQNDGSQLFPSPEMVPAPVSLESDSKIVQILNPENIINHAIAYDYGRWGELAHYVNLCVFAIFLIPFRTVLAIVSRGEGSSSSYCRANNITNNLRETTYFLATKFKKEWVIYPQQKLDKCNNKLRTIRLTDPQSGKKILDADNKEQIVKGKRIHTTTENSIYLTEAGCVIAVPRGKFSDKTKQGYMVYNPASTDISFDDFKTVFRIISATLENKHYHDNPHIVRELAPECTHYNYSDLYTGIIWRQKPIRPSEYDNSKVIGSGGLGQAIKPSSHPFIKKVEKNMFKDYNLSEASEYFNQISRMLRYNNKNLREKLSPPIIYAKSKNHQIKSSSRYIEGETLKCNTPLTHNQFYQALETTYHAQQIGLYMVDNKQNNWIYDVKTDKMIRIDLLLDAGIYLKKCYNHDLYSTAFGNRGSFFGNYRFFVTTPRKRRGKVTGECLSDMRKLDFYIHSEDDTWRLSALAELTLTYITDNERNLYAEQKLSDTELINRLKARLPDTLPSPFEKESLAQFAINWLIADNFDQIKQFYGTLDFRATKTV